MSVNTNKSQDYKKVTIRFSPEQYEDIASLAKKGIRSMPQQMLFMSKTWLPMALKLCELYERGTPDAWAANLWKEYREKKALSEILRIITDHESSLADRAGEARL